MKNLVVLDEMGIRKCTLGRLMTNSMFASGNPKCHSDEEKRPTGGTHFDEEFVIDFST